MKGFIMAMLLAGAALFLAALLWPGHSKPVATRSHGVQTIGGKVEAREMWQRDAEDNSPESRSRPSTRPMTERLAASNAIGRSSDLPSSPATSLTNSALSPKAKRTSGSDLSADEQTTLKETGTDNTSLRDPNFPRTYISKIHVDLTSPNHSVTLTWTGPNANKHPATAYHSSPGRGLGYNNCDDPTESCRTDSNCTPKGTFQVQAFSNSMVTSPECRFVTWFNTKRGIALHYYPNVPNYPASHGCVRLNMNAAQIIHNNSKIGETEVVVDGMWKFAR